MKYLIATLLIIVSICGSAQESKIKIYNPEANAKEELDQALVKAKEEGKHVLIQVGGNWCPWCIKLHNFIEEHPRVDSVISSDYEFVRVNYSKENKNWDLMERFEFPQRFGFPVIVILDENGKRIHTQETASLEEDKAYSEKKIMDFLESWNMKALDPETYK